jgi:DNA-binding protein H-NS
MQGGPHDKREKTMIELDSMTRGELVKLRGDVDKAIASVADRERRKAIEAAERAAAEHGFSLAELTGAPVSTKRVKSKSPAKYRNPADPTQTWSGRGRKPRWIIDASAEGRDLSDYEI